MHAEPDPAVPGRLRSRGRDEGRRSTPGARTRRLSQAPRPRKCQVNPTARGLEPKCYGMFLVVVVMVVMIAGVMTMVVAMAMLIV